MTQVETDVKTKAMSEFQKRLCNGLCPRCGARFGKSRMDHSNLKRVPGADPSLLNHWGAYEELIAECGHRVKCYIKK